MSSHSGNSSDDPLERLEQAAGPIHHELGWRRRRDVSLALHSALERLVGSEKAAAIAHRMTGVQPESLLSYGGGVLGTEATGC